MKVEESPAPRGTIWQDRLTSWLKAQEARDRSIGTHGKPDDEDADGTAIVAPPQPPNWPRLFPGI